MAASRKTARKAATDSKNSSPTASADTKGKARTGKKSPTPKPEDQPEKVEVPVLDAAENPPAEDVEMPSEEPEPTEVKKAAKTVKKVAPKKAAATEALEPPAVEAAEDAEMEEAEPEAKEASPEPKKAGKAGKKAAAPKKTAVKTVPEEKACPPEDVEMDEEEPTPIVEPKKAGKGRPAKTAEPARGVKRGRAVKEDVNVTKRIRLDEGRLALRGPHLVAVVGEGGILLTLGQGDTGQLGHGPDVMEASKPKLCTAFTDKPVVAISAGGMHSLALTKEGVVYSFGCNDDGALGRLTEDDDETYTPGEVALDGKIVQISAGDSHSAALTSEGKVYYWGTFRDNSGTFGLTPDGKNQPMPIPLAHHLTVRKIASGENHIVMLTQDGQLYTVGCGEQGRLGRIGELFVGRGGRRGLALPLTPDIVHAKNRRVVFADVWAGSMSTVALTTDNEVLVCGLNNYSQLGIDKKTEIFVMTTSPAFTKIAKESGLAQVVFGQHHVMLLDAAGKVYSLGRHDYGVLGQGEGLTTEVKVPTQVLGDLEKEPSYEIACGSAVSYAVTTSGTAYSWGMCTNLQLGHAEEEDALIPTKMLGKQLATNKVIGVSSGGQHTLLLAKAKPE